MFFLQPQKLGRTEKIVKIDDSKFGKRKYHRDHHVKDQLVFGSYKCGSDRVFMVAVDDRKATHYFQ